MSVSCDQLDDYLFGILTDVERAAFDDHLSVCETCRKEVLSEARFRSNLKWQASRIQVPPVSSQVLLERHRSHDRPSGSASPRIVVFAALVTLTVFAGGIASIGRLRLTEHQESHGMARTNGGLDPELETHGSFAKSSNAGPLRPQTERPQTEQWLPVFPRSPSVRTSDDVIAVPVDSGDPDVTIVVLFPALK